MIVSSTLLFTRREGAAFANRVGGRWWDGQEPGRGADRARSENRSPHLDAALSVSSIKIVAMAVREMNFMRQDVGQLTIASASLERGADREQIARIDWLIRLGIHG